MKIPVFLAVPKNRDDGCGKGQCGATGYFGTVHCLLFWRLNALLTDFVADLWAQRLARRLLFHVDFPVLAHLLL